MGRFLFVFGLLVFVFSFIAFVMNFLFGFDGNIFLITTLAMLNGAIAMGVADVLDEVKKLSKRSSGNETE